jgi:hypothetical protein
MSMTGECRAGTRAGPYSSITSFEIAGSGGGPCPPTASPTPIGPTGTVTSTRPTFTWSPVDGAETYTVHVQRVSTGEVVA